MRRRIAVSVAAFLLSFSIAFAYRVLVRDAGNDLELPLCGASALAHGIDPYGPACAASYNGLPAATYPLTTLLALIPFSVAPPVLASLIVWSAINALLAFVIYQTGQPWRALVFASGAYWQAFRWLQFSPLLLAMVLLPNLLPLALVKPQLGLPVILTHLTKRRAVACILFLVLTLAVYPAWPLNWLASARHYDGWIPLLALPLGPLLLFSLVRWRDPRNRFLLLSAAMPQRGIYDALALWSLPQTKKEMLWLTGLSWIGVAVEWLGNSMPFPPLAAVACVYLPLLVILNYKALTSIFRMPALARLRLAALRRY